MSIWKTTSSCVEKPWGGEVGFCSPFGMSGKILYIKADHRTSLKYYRHQNQLMYCLEGEVLVFCPNEREFGDIKTNDGNYHSLKPGDVILIQAENPYRIKALQKSRLVEVIINSSGIDAVMLEDDYGRKIPGEELPERDI
jgi:mannose-6-phosphate isomerase-like protein (cupin superfamily)